MSRRIEIAAKKQQVKIIRCRNCAHFETDHMELVDGIPMILAHNICTRWGDGCATSPDGFCFLAEGKEQKRHDRD